MNYIWLSIAKAEMKMWFGCTDGARGRIHTPRMLDVWFSATHWDAANASAEAERCDVFGSLRRGTAEGERDSAVYVLGVSGWRGKNAARIGRVLGRWA